MSYLASIDQSTTSSKFTLFTPSGALLDQQIIPHAQICPEEGWLEHDPVEIMGNVRKCIETVMERSKVKAGDVLGLGVTNQRETVVVWDREGRPYCNAIVWCDSRSQQVCQEFRQAHGEMKQLTGLPVSTYFTLFKLLWLRKHRPEVAQAVDSGEARIGTIDAWVVYNITREFVTDASNASRTFMASLSGRWEPSLLKIAGIRQEQLPTIVDSFSKVGRVKEGALAGVEVCCILGDQQSSAYAHELSASEAKITFGTGCFLMAPLGLEPVIDYALITTVLHRQGQAHHYAYECSVECGAGTVNWAKRVGLFESFQELNHCPIGSADSEVCFMPSFGEIYAPFWKSGVKGGVLGLTLATSSQQILAALLEAVIFRVYDNLKGASFDKVTKLFVDGGMTVNAGLMQAQASLLGKPVTVRERDTCWGVAKGVLTCLGREFEGFAEEKSVTYHPDPQVTERLRVKYGKWCEERRKYYGWK